MSILTTYVQQVAEREKAATPGEWSTNQLTAKWQLDVQTGESIPLTPTVAIVRRIPSFEEVLRSIRLSQADAAFIVHARTDIPRMLAIIEEQEKDIERLLKCCPSASPPAVEHRASTARIERIAAGEEGL